MPLQNAQYDTIMREYDRRRQLHRHELDERREILYKKLPRLSEIHNSIASLSVRAVRHRLFGSDEALIACRDEIDKLVQERKTLLTAHGYPEDYLNMQYDCPDCEDTGFIEGEKCHCFKKAAVDLLYTQSNMQEILQKENFTCFSFDYYSDTIRNEVTGLTARETAQDAVRQARHFIKTFGSEFHNLFLYGSTGVGKTFLTNCIAKELIDQTYCVIYFTAFDFFDTLAKSTFQKEQSCDDIQEDILSCDLLIIDDLGTELTNTFVTSALFQCINERIMRKKSTIISTNLSLDQFNDIYSERIFSRITSNYTMIKLIGKDIRIQKRLLGGKQ